MALLRGRRRTAYVLISALILMIYLITVPWNRPVPESILLQRHMNYEGSATRTKAVKSSFDWARVKVAHPPPPIRPLPTIRDGRTPILPRVQHRFGSEPAAVRRVREARRDAVRAVFRRNWASYREYAWKTDALLPLSRKGRDQFSGWAATLVDALDTLWIMGLRDEFDEAVEAVASIDFGKSSSPRVNVFETNIRYLGGLMAAYDLSGREVLLEKARELGDLIYAGFDTEKRMPVDFIDMQRAMAGEGLTVEGSVVSASPGTLSMELTHLSQLTGDARYYTAAANLMEVFYQQQNKTRLPGMWPIYISMSSQDLTGGTSFTLGGSADSLYEYLPKMHQLLGGLEPMYEDMSRTFMSTADENFFFRPMLPDGEDILISGNVNVFDDAKPVLDPESEHLTCFIGGAFALAGRLFRQPNDVLTGAKLAKGCAYAYRAFPTGMMPERYNMAPCASRATTDACTWDEAVWETEKGKRREWEPHLPLGFTTAKDPRYILRPEAIESVFVLYRVTGETWYEDTAWEMFRAIENGTRTEIANAAVLDVTRKAEKLPQEDYMESFWLAETLKYFYLVFSPPDVISLDEYVLNTEAHPFRRPR